jgi:hypothetical protein
VSSSSDPPSNKRLQLTPNSSFQHKPLHQKGCLPRWDWSPRPHFGFRREFAPVLWRRTCSARSGDEGEPRRLWADPLDGEPRLTHCGQELEEKPTGLLHVG